MVKYTLKKHGDSYEKEGCGYQLDEKFEAYEAIWATYITRLTLRPYSIILKPDVPAELEYFCMAHYSTWYHLTVAQRLINKLQQPYDISVHPPEAEIAQPAFHLASVVDLAICTVTSAFRLHNYLDRRQKRKGLAEKFKSYQQCNWRQVLENYVDFNDEEQPVAPLLIVEKQIGLYRNSMAHNTIRPHLVDENRVLRLPSKEHIEDCWLWSSAARTDNRDKYQPAHRVYSTLLSDLSKTLNGLWSLLNTPLDAIKQDDNYEKLFVVNQEPADYTVDTFPNQPSGLRTDVSGTFDVTNDRPLNIISPRQHHLLGDKYEGGSVISSASTDLYIGRLHQISQVTPVINDDGTEKKESDSNKEAIPPTNDND